MLSIIKNIGNLYRLSKLVQVKVEDDNVRLYLDRSIGIQVKGHVVLTTPEGHTIISAELIHLNPPLEPMSIKEEEKDKVVINSKQVLDKKIYWKENKNVDERSDVK